RFTWVFFLATKDETSSILKTFVTGLETQLSLKGIKKEFSVPRTPQQNGIAERKNMTLTEATGTMLTDSLLPIPFWAEAVNTACYVQNRVLVTKPQNKTPYELLHGRTPSIGFMRPFGCLVTILNTLDSLGKFEAKNKEGDTTFDAMENQFEDFSKNSSNDVSAASPIVPAAGQNCSNNTNPISAAGPSNSNSSSTHENSSLREVSQSPDVLEMENIVYSDIENVGAEADFNNLESLITVSPIPTTRIHNAHPISQIIGQFKGKVDEGFLVGYSVHSKAFRVSNSQTRIIQETLHVNFLENTPNVAGTGPTWLFDIDILTRTMSYQPVIAGNQTNANAGDTTFDAMENQFEDFSKDSSNDVSAASPIVPAAG
nr:hypothetical protein [Tanacetum cinerariifolium]